MGGSACVIAKVKRPERDLRLFDVFELLPPPSNNYTLELMRVYEYFRSGQVQGFVDINYVTHARICSPSRKTTDRSVSIPTAPTSSSLMASTGNVEGRPAYRIRTLDCDRYVPWEGPASNEFPISSVRTAACFSTLPSYEGVDGAGGYVVKADRRFKIIHEHLTVEVQRITH